MNHDKELETTYMSNNSVWFEQIIINLYSGIPSSTKIIFEAYLIKKIHGKNKELNT